MLLMIHYVIFRRSADDLWTFDNAASGRKRRPKSNGRQELRPEAWYEKVSLGAAFLYLDRISFDLRRGSLPFTSTYDVIRAREKSE